MKEREAEGKSLAQHLLAWHQATVKKMMRCAKPGTLNSILKQAGLKETR